MRVCGTGWSERQQCEADHRRVRFHGQLACTSLLAPDLPQLNEAPSLDIPGDRVVIAHGDGYRDRGARSRCSFSPPVEGFTTQFFWRIFPTSLQGLEDNECSISSSAGISCWRMICRPGKKHSDCATRNTVWITSSSRRRNQFRAPAHRLTADHEW